MVQEVTKMGRCGADRQIIVLVQRDAGVKGFCAGGDVRATMFAHDMPAVGSADVILAGGMESMTNAPYLLPKARGGVRMGHAW